MGRRVEMSALRADGNEFPVEMVLWRTESAGAFYTASINDLTERRAAASRSSASATRCARARSSPRWAACWPAWRTS